MTGRLRFDSDDQRYAWLNRLALREGEVDAKEARARYRAYVTLVMGRLHERTA